MVRICALTVFGETDRSPAISGRVRLVGRALGGQLVGGPGRPLRAGPGNQQPFPLQPLKALGEDIRGDPGDLAEQVIEPLGPAEQPLDHQ
jgi:hypothetical protein